MPPKKVLSRKPKSSPSSSAEPPEPFKRAPEALASFYGSLSPAHAYIAHVDSKPADFKRKIFLVPVAINLAITLLFAWRVYYVSPWYFALLASALGHSNETTVAASDSPWGAITWIIARRAFTFLLDFLLFVFVWPWPVEFCFARTHGSPAQWRWNVGFRDKEIYVRRSRPTWDAKVRQAVKGEDFEARSQLLTNIGVAVNPMLLNEKTGYLTMNNEWDLDWAAMVGATRLVDKKAVALDSFKLLVLVHHEGHGWLVLDLKETRGDASSDDATVDERRTQVFAFRDALAAVGKEDLFYRWIEIVQFESSQPGGFGPEKQVEVAQKIRDLFEEQGVDFDEFWKESVGSDGLANM